MSWKKEGQLNGYLFVNLEKAKASEKATKNQINILLRMRIREIEMKSFGPKKKGKRVRTERKSHKHDMSQ